MIRLHTVVGAVFAVLLMASNLHAAVTPPNAKARVFGVSPNMVSANIPGIDVPSNGLPNVGKGSKVYLYCGGKPSTGSGSDKSATHFKSAVFTLFEKPAGSASDFQTIDSIRAFFIPDMEGTYRISMIGTDDQDRTDGDTLVVNVAKYVGVGGLVGAAAFPECSFCHQAKYDTYKNTAHATALIRKLDDPDTAASHFKQFACTPCHSNGSTNSAADDDGWQARARALGWTFPATIGPGTWDALKTNFPELAKMGNIQCENCHGPGSAHMGNTADNKIAVTVTSEQCNQCHDAPPYHVKKAEYENSAHSYSTDEPDAPEYMNRGSSTSRSSDCARCHTSNGYIDVFHKSADPATAFTKAPYKDVGYVGCVTCHNPHDATIPNQLRKEGDKICADCHTVRVSSRGLHSSHQGPMLQGVDGIEFPGYTYNNSAHTFIAEQCVKCHMAPPPDKSLQNKIGGHTFRVKYDNDTPADPADDIINNTGCMDCHGGGVTLQEVEETQADMKSLLAQLAALLPKQANGSPIAPGDTTQPQLVRDCAFNYWFVYSDGSFGVHNNQYATDLLTSSIAMMGTLGVERIDGAAGDFALAQNYPNPFNPSTEIRFDVARSSAVRIAVYDANGREVCLLVNGMYQPGSYRVRWNGTGENQVLMPSGVYFYSMTAGSFTATQKMVLMK